MGAASFGAALFFCYNETIEVDHDAHSHNRRR